MKKEMILLTDEENELYKMQKICFKSKKIFSTDKNLNYLNLNYFNYLYLNYIIK